MFWAAASGETVEIYKKNARIVNQSLNLRGGNKSKHEPAGQKQHISEAKHVLSLSNIDFPKGNTFWRRTYRFTARKIKFWSHAY